MKLMYLLLQLVMCCFVAIMIQKTFDVVPLAGGSPGKKVKGVFLNGILLIGFVKVVMNQYPSLHDLHLLVLLMLLNGRFMAKRVDIISVLIIGVAYSIFGSAFLWITWLQRFSGNANFFYFQTLAYNAFLVLLFIQIYLAVDEKRKRYGRVKPKTE